jgi:hypothetical protein
MGQCRVGCCQLGQCCVRCFPTGRFPVGCCLMGQCRVACCLMGQCRVALLPNGTVLWDVTRWMFSGGTWQGYFLMGECRAVCHPRHRIWFCNVYHTIRSGPGQRIWFGTIGQCTSSDFALWAWHWICCRAKYQSAESDTLQCVSQYRVPIWHPETESS